MLPAESTSVARNRSPSLPIALLTSALLTGCLGAPADGITPCTAVDEDDLEALALMESADCVLEVRNTSLTSLDALAGLKRVNGFLITDNASLVDVDVFGELEPFDMLTARRTPLSDVLDVTNVSVDLRLEESDVESLQGAQARIALLQVEKNASLTSIVFASLTEASDINLTGNPTLTTLTGSFPALTSLPRLTVSGCPLISTAEIEELATQANVPTEGFYHCGNLDDGPCESSPELN